MSRDWTRLSILAFLALLYAAPLSSGDKGLWLSVTAMPVPLSGALPEGMPPEHAILLPIPALKTHERACTQRIELPPAPGALPVLALALTTTGAAVSAAPIWSPPDPASLTISVPRGPPA